MRIHSFFSRTNERALVNQLIYGNWQGLECAANVRQGEFTICLCLVRSWEGKLIEVLGIEYGPSGEPGVGDQYRIEARNHQSSVSCQVIPAFLRAVVRWCEKLVRSSFSLAPFPPRNTRSIITPADPRRLLFVLFFQTRTNTGTNHTACIFIEETQLTTLPKLLSRV